MHQHERLKLESTYADRDHDVEQLKRPLRVSIAQKNAQASVTMASPHQKTPVQFRSSTRLSSSCAFCLHKGR
jgi:hypothetical protein